MILFSESKIILFLSTVGRCKRIGGINRTGRRHLIYASGQLRHLAVHWNRDRRLPYFAWRSDGEKLRSHSTTMVFIFNFHLRTQWFDLTLFSKFLLTQYHMFVNILHRIVSLQNTILFLYCAVNIHADVASCTNLHKAA